MEDTPSPDSSTAVETAESSSDGEDLDALLFAEEEEEFVQVTEDGELPQPIECRALEPSDDGEELAYEKGDLLYLSRIEGEYGYGQRVQDGSTEGKFVLAHVEQIGWAQAGLGATMMPQGDNSLLDKDARLTDDMVTAVDEHRLNNTLECIILLPKLSNREY